MHYCEAERLRRVAIAYAHDHPGRDYFKDLIRAHHLIGLSLSYAESEILVELTPKKDKGIMIISSTLTAASAAAHAILRCFIDKLNVVSFNLGSILPPLKHEASWEVPFPAITRIVDRGGMVSANPPINSPSDVGAAEMFITSIIETDPFKLMGKIREAIVK